MKKTLKLIALMLAAMMMLAMFAGCSADKAEDADVLTVALSPDFSPMEFVDTSKSGQDQFVGFDVTLAKFIAEEMGKELVIKAMSFDACQTAVQLGSVDMSISGFSWTPERAENFLLSDYYYAGENETEQTIIVLAEKAGTFAAAEDFSGLTVAAQSASLQMNLCTSQLPEDTEIAEYKAIDDAVLALKTGKVDAVAVATGNGEAIIANNPDLGMSGFNFEVDEAAENNVILLNKESEELLAEVNEILAKALEAGYYGEWYAEAQELAGIDTAADVAYDEEGNVVE
ncbi:MAG: transporter substrate-binding domain-containing protein [Ruminococcaceae bacterium]|nr:transporter substrate-binding domain-containing protein [Oscillospiraceae bacterium]